MAVSRVSRSPVAHVLIGGCIGCCLAFLTFDVPFLAGTGPKWDRPTEDLNAYRVAANYFLADRWRLPVLTLPDMGYPEGGSVAYNDAIPLGALVAKLVATASPARWNYLGGWVLLCWLLQGALAARLAFLLGNRSLLVAGSLACLACSTKMYILRACHIGALSHFLLFWALIVYVRLQERARSTLLLLMPLTVAAFLIQLYLFAMVSVIEGAALLSACRRWLEPRVAIRSVAATGLALAFLFLAGGYAKLNTAPQSYGEAGYGIFSWNIVTLVTPDPEGIWAGITDGLVRNATGGQYEGESYVGIGTLMLLGVLLVLRGKLLWCEVRRHWILLVALLACTAYAASNRVYVGSVLVLDLHLPPLLSWATSLFRAGGRFIWPLAYVLIALSPIFAARWFSARVAVPLILLAAAVQVIEATPSRTFMRSWSRLAAPDVINIPVMSAWMKEHDRVWQFPSWYCGGLADHSNPEAANREYELQVLASRLRLPMNSVYMSRPFKDCSREAAQAASLGLKPGILYIFGPNALARSPGIAAIARSSACRSLDWAVVCSQKWEGSRPAGDQTEARQPAIEPAAIGVVARHPPFRILPLG